MKLTKKQLVLLLFFSPILALGLMGDIVLFLFTSSKNCVQCGIEEVIKDGIFVRSINSVIGIHA